MHEHRFMRVWRCEHVTFRAGVWVRHSMWCSLGRWVWLCNCGEPGYEVPEAVLVRLRYGMEESAA